MAIQFTLDVCRPDGSPVPSGTKVWVKYDRQVRLAEGSVPPLLSKPLVMGGSYDTPVVEIPYANDDPALAHDSQGFGIMVHASWPEGYDRATWDWFVAIDSSMGEAVKLSALPEAGLVLPSDPAGYIPGPPGQKGDKGDPAGPSSIVLPGELGSDAPLGGVIDQGGRRTWLEFGGNGGPSELSVGMMLDSLGGRGLVGGSANPDGGFGFALVTTDGYKLIEWDETGKVADWVAHQIGDTLGIRSTPGKPTTVTVAADGTGDYADPKSAVAAVSANATDITPYVILIHPGTYETIDLVAHPAGDGLIVPDHVTVRGTDRDAVILRGECPTGTDPAVVQASPTVDLSKNGALENLTVIGTNTRYPVHSESAGNFPNATQQTKNVRIVTTSGGTAWGCGVSSGNTQHHVGSVFDARGGNSAVTVHNNLAFAAPVEFTFDKCAFIAPIGYMKMQSLGAGQQGVVTMTGCDLSVGAVQYDDTPWMPTTAAGQYADHVEIELWADGRQKVPWSCITRGRALRIDSATTTGESITVSGSAALLLMGPNPLQTNGGGGLTTYLTGYWDMSGITVGSAGTTPVNNTLGKRLGDCSTTGKTLTVTVGASSKTVTFNTNLTSVDNATILASINTALSGVATASLFDVSGNHRYPQFTDRQQTALNNGSVGISRWSAVGYEVDNTIRPMTAGLRFAGVALDQIPPSATGRILTSGALYASTQAAGLESATIAAGTKIYLGAGGTFTTTSGAQQLATSVSSTIITFQGA